jgi:hypothetical protein
MENQMTKAKLLDELRSARAEWDALMREIGEARMTESGATGFWSVKDVMAHLMSYTRWYVNALEAHFRGEAPPMDGTEHLTDWDERNAVYYQRTKDLSLAEVTVESRRVHDRLVELVESQPEEFLVQPQQFIGAPMTVIPWKHLEGDVYDHTRRHTRDLRTWLEANPA